MLIVWNPASRYYVMLVRQELVTFGLGRLGVSSEIHGPWIEHAILVCRMPPELITSFVQREVLFSTAESEYPGTFCYVDAKIFRVTDVIKDCKPIILSIFSVAAITLHVGTLAYPLPSMLVSDMSDWSSRPLTAPREVCGFCNTKSEKST